VPASVSALRVDEPVESSLNALVPEVAEPDQGACCIARRAQVAVLHEPVPMAKMDASMHVGFPTRPWSEGAILRGVKIEPHLDCVRDPFVAAGEAEVREDLQLPDRGGELRQVASFLRGPVSLRLLPFEHPHRPAALRHLRPEPRQDALVRPWV